MFDFLKNAASSVKNFFTGSTTPPIQPTMNYTPAPIPQTVAPNMSTPVGPAKGTIGANTVTYNTSAGAVSVPGKVASGIASGNQTPAIYGLTTNNPLVVPKATTVRQSTAPISTPQSFVMKDPVTGQLVDTRYNALSGASGQAGSSSVNLGFGSSGTGGASPSPYASSSRLSVGGGPTGLVSGLGGSISEQQKQNLQTISGMSLNPENPAVLKPTLTDKTGAPMQLPPMPYGPESMTNGSMLTVSPPRSIPGVTSIVQPKPFGPDMSTPVVPPQMTTGSLTSMSDASKKALSAPGADSDNDLVDVMNEVSTKANELAQQLLNKDNMPPDPVEESPNISAELQNILNTQGQTAFQQAQAQIDQMYKDLGMSNIIQQEKDINAQYAATSKIVNDLYKDIKDNPDLPAALKDRRMKAIQEQYAPFLESLQSTLKDLNLSYQQRNDQLTATLGLANTISDKENRQKTQALSTLQMFLDAGATLSSADKKYFSSVLGVDSKTLDTIAKKKDVGTFQDSNGQQVFYDKNTMQEIARLGTAKSAGVGSAGASLTGSQATRFSGLTKKFDAAIAVANKAKSLEALAEEVVKNPSSASNQLNLIYSYIKGLDTDSAVREGEIDLIRAGTQSFLDRGKASIERISQGKPISTAAALEIATGAKTLVKNIYEQALSKDKFISSEAITYGIQDAWNEHRQRISTNVPWDNQTTAPQQTADEYLNSVMPAEGSSGNWFSDLFSSIKSSFSTTSK